MKTLSKLLFVALAIITISAMASFDQERQVRNFKGVMISGPLNAIVKIGPEEKVRLEGDQEAIAQLITEVRDGILIIRPKTKWREWNKKFDKAKVTAYVTAKSLTSLTLSGSGSINVQNQVAATELATTLSGSGNIKVPANVKSLTAVISGSGNIESSGKAMNANITINGSGNFKGAGFAVDVASTQISGSGSIYIRANKKIDAVSSGSGTVYYTGNPTIEKTVVGSGGVQRN